VTAIRGVGPVSAAAFLFALLRPKAVNVLFDQNPDSSSEHGLCKRQYQFDELSVPRAVGLTPVVHAEMVFIRPAVEES
jgi:hypothetical protein